MRQFIIAGILILASTQSFAQNRKIDFSFQVFEIPQKTLGALEKYLEKGGQEAKKAYSKLGTLSGVKDLYSMTGEARSGERGKVSKDDFEIEYDPVLSADGLLVDLNYAVEIPTREPTSFFGQVVVPVGQPFLTNAWIDDSKVIAFFVTATVVGAPVPDKPADLEVLKCDLTILKLRSTRDAESVSKMNGQLATEKVENEGRIIYHQLCMTRSGQRSRGGRGDRSLEIDPVLGADRSQVALSLAFREDEESYSGSKTIPVGTSSVIPLSKNGEASPMVLLIQPIYLGTTENLNIPANVLPKFAAPDDLVTQAYVVPPDFLMNLQKKLALPNTMRSSAKEVLSGHGISFENGATSIFNAGTGKLIFRNVKSEHKKLLDLIQKN